MAKYTHDDQMDFLYEFAKNYQHYVPDSKDNMRASDCLKKPNPVSRDAETRRLPKPFST